MRHQVRFQISALCRFWWSEKSLDLNFGSGRTRDLSSGGVSIIAGVMPPLDARVMVEIDLPRPGGPDGTPKAAILLRAEGTVLRRQSLDGEFVVLITHAAFEGGYDAEEYKSLGGYFNAAQ